MTLEIQYWHTDGGVEPINGIPTLSSHQSKDFCLILFSQNFSLIWNLFFVSLFWYVVLCAIYQKSANNKRYNFKYYTLKYISLWNYRANLIPVNL